MYRWRLYGPGILGDQMRWMEEAISEAKKCESSKKFGAVIVHRGSVLARAHSTVWEDHDPTQHAELKAVSEACRALGSDRHILREAEIYSTCQPCLMCLGAILWAKIGWVVYGMDRSDSPHNFADSEDWHLPFWLPVDKTGKPLFQLVGGVLGEECKALLPPP